MQGAFVIGTKTKIRTGRGKKDKPSPLRQCALTREKLPADELLRFSLSPQKIVTPDLRCKLPGRGLWLKADRSILVEAIKKNSFARGFREKALVSNDLVDMIEKLTRIDALHTLSLANKAGHVITGYEKIKRALAKGDVKWLLHAMEASRNGSDKLDRYFAPPREEPEDEDDLVSRDTRETGNPIDQKNIAAILGALFTGDELSLALGRHNVIHIGLKRGEMAKRFTFAHRKYSAFNTRQEDVINKDNSLL
ncbi:MAG: DUF448 domain-containing protein [bacterium]|nr:DUF448 domain-containing protein [bacterium]